MVLTVIEHAPAYNNAQFLHLIFHHSKPPFGSEQAAKWPGRFSIDYFVTSKVQCGDQ